METDSLKEPRLVFGLVVVTKLDLTLIASKLTGFVKRDWMGAIQNVIPGLSDTYDEHYDENTLLQQSVPILGT